jgi:hypothetical protein
MTGAFGRWYHLRILLIVLLAFGLRLYAIERQDIWGDEAFSIWLSNQPPSTVVAGGADTHPPFYPLSLHLWMRLVGPSSLAIRYFSAFVGTLIVPVVCIMGRRVVSPKEAQRVSLSHSPALKWWAGRSQTCQPSWLLDRLSWSTMPRRPACMAW